MDCNNLKDKNGKIYKQIWKKAYNTLWGGCLMRKSILIILFIVLAAYPAAAECIPSGEVNTGCDITKCCGYTGVWTTAPAGCEFGMQTWIDWCNAEGSQNCPLEACWVSICVPNCEGKVCGDDGCGGLCGTCNNGYYCNIGQCKIIDNDGDGYNNAEDCNDWDEKINPGAIELCDGIDNNCNGKIDEVCDIDDDGDGYSLDKDCDDNNAEINPDAIEILGNNIDENCDGKIICNPESEWKNHGEFVSCVAKEAQNLFKDGKITKKERDEIVAKAAKTGIGKKFYMQFIQEIRRLLFNK
jgi:hypothetical protein